MLPKMKEGKWGPYFLQYRSRTNRYHLICWMFPEKKEDKILISLDARKNTDYLNYPLCRDMKEGKNDPHSPNISKNNLIWFELPDASENERREIISLFPLIQKIKETIDILFELLHVSGKKENKILVSPTSQEQTYCLCVWQLLPASI